MAKSSYVSDLVEGSQVVDFFLVSAATVRKTKRDKDYLSLVLVDKTGEMEARVWDIPAGLDPSTIVERTFVKVKGSVSEYNDKLQLSITQIRAAEIGEFEFEDFFRRSVRDPEEMYFELLNVLTDQLAPEWRSGGLGGPTYRLLIKVLEENKDQWLLAPAAKSVHHCFLGGLLEHVLSMSKVAVAVSEHYGLRKDLMLAGCVLHDVGKLKELTYDMGIGYSTEGTLLGHIVLGLEMVAQTCREIPEIDAKLKMEILHIVASHHGTLSWGSPKVPMFREALAFHSIDSMDAKLEICNEILRSDRSDGDFASFSKYIDAFLYKGVDSNG